MLKPRQCLLVSLAMGLLMIQIAPSFGRRSSSSGSSESSESDSVTCTSMVDPEDLANTLVQGAFDYLIGLLVAFALCLDGICAVQTDCFACFAATFPPPPTLSEGLLDIECS